MQSKLVKSLIAAAVLGTSFIGLEQANAMPIVPGDDGAAFSSG